MKRLIIDGNNLVHRVYWVSKNQPQFNEYFHIHLFLTSVKNYVLKYKPDITYCAWDEKADYQVNKRKELSEDYKSNRDSEKNKDVHTKNYIIKELLKYLGINSVQPHSYEADDVIAIFCDKFKDDEKVIITVDRDLCQLIDDKTIVFDPIRKVEFTIVNFEETLKCKKKDFLTIKALAGDKSDNIQGIKGFGKVKIQKYLNEEVFLAPHEVDQFCKNMKLLDLSHTLKCESEYAYVSEQLEKESTIDSKEFKRSCEGLDFHQILKKYDEWYRIFFEKKTMASVLSQFITYGT
jgi:DNA polymerase-1